MVEISLGAIMERRHLNLASIATCALIAAPAFAQPAVQPATKAAPATTKVAVAAAPQAGATTNAKGLTPASLTMFAAAGSVIILSDGIVARANIAQIVPPAPGFEYER